jgi:hypothetical protein
MPDKPPVPEPDVTARATASALIPAYASSPVHDSHTTWRQAADALARGIDAISFSMMDDADSEVRQVIGRMADDSDASWPYRGRPDTEPVRRWLRLVTPGLSRPWLGRFARIVLSAGVGRGRPARV